MNWAALRTGIFSNGLSTKKSLSPLMIQSAFAALASDKNLSSFASRQISTDIVTSIKILLFSKAFRASSLDCRDI